MTKKRSLTDEEKDLWNRISSKIVPLKKNNRKHLPEKPPVYPDIKPRVRKPLEQPNEALSAYTQAERSPFLQAHSPKELHRVRKVEIEARLDLHGKTKDQAWKSLTRFLASCQDRGYLWVLIITGKGRMSTDTQSEQRGVLRDMLPKWLEDPTLQPLVSGYTPAKPQDGGKGAFYVRLKRRR